MKSTANRTRPKVMNAGMVGLILWAGSRAAGGRIMGFPPALFKRKWRPAGRSSAFRTGQILGWSAMKLQDDVTAALACCSNMIFRKKPPPTRRAFPIDFMQTGSVADGWRAQDRK